jgi:hypothetical protein
MEQQLAKEARKMSPRKRNLWAALFVFILSKIIPVLSTGFLFESIGAFLEVSALVYLIFGIIGYNFKEGREWKYKYSIIGLAFLVLVASNVYFNNSVNGGMKVSAMTSLTSVFPEIITCQSDDFGLNAYDTTKTICNDTGNVKTHTMKWPDISETGYVVSADAATNANISNYVFSAKNGSSTITCSFEDVGCK